MACISGNDEERYRLIAQQRAAQFKKEGSFTRARSQDGQPVTYRKVKEKANMTRRSRVMSDPEIPGSLVILNAKGLFQGKNGTDNSNTHSLHRPERVRSACINTMNAGVHRPQFFDPSLGSKEAKVSNLRKKFEPFEYDIGEEIPGETGSDFLNPLHKINQGGKPEIPARPPQRVLVLPREPPKRVRSETELEEAPCSNSAPTAKKLQTGGKPEIPAKPPSRVQVLPREPPKRVQSVTELEKALCSKSAPTANKAQTGKKPEIPARPPPRLFSRDHPKRLRGETVPTLMDRNQLSQMQAYGQEKKVFEEFQEENKAQTVSKPEIPPRPRPRVLALLQDPPKRLRGETDPMPLDKNQMSRTQASGQENMREEFQEESSSQQRPETENSADMNKSNGNGDSNDDDDDFDTDEWTSEDDLLEFPDAVSKKLYNIAMEILTTERAYVRRLHLLHQVFYSQINSRCCAKGILPQEVLSDIFSNIQAIHQLHRYFLLPKLEARMKEWGTNNQIGDILKGLAPFLKMYAIYVGNFDKATETLLQWMKKSPAMAEVINEIQKSKECGNLTLQHHMLEPVQRVPRYRLLLKDYVSKLPEDSSDLKNSSDALEIISESARHANDRMKETERFKILLDIQKRIGEDYPLITTSREFVMEGEFKKLAARTTDSHQERTLMLFNDVLLCCAKFPGTNKYKVKVEMDLFGMEVVDVDEELELENSFRIISKQRVMDFTAPSAEAKKSWINKLQDTVNEHTSRRETYRRARDRISKIEVMQDVELGKKAPTWVRDEAVSMCMLCDVMFTRFRRRHHCRACGRVMCASCSGIKTAMEYKNGKLEKVCEVCRKILVKGLENVMEKENEGKKQSVLKIADESKIWHSGYLNHKMKGDKSWQRRWFVLSSDFVLLRYKAKKDTKAEFNLPLPGHKVDKPSLADEFEVDGKTRVFKLNHKNVKVYFFEAESEESMNRWMKLLRHAVNAEQIDEEEFENQKNNGRANSVNFIIE